jgi:hypothetical protein
MGESGVVNPGARWYSPARWKLFPAWTFQSACIRRSPATEAAGVACTRNVAMTSRVVKGHTFEAGSGEASMGRPIASAARSRPNEG